MYKAILMSIVSLGLQVVSDATSLSWSMNSIKLPVDDPVNLASPGTVSAYLFFSEINSANESWKNAFQLISLEDIVGLIRKRGDISDYVACQQVNAGNGFISGATGVNGTNWSQNETATAIVIIFDSTSYENASNFLVTTSSPIEVTLGKSGATTLRVGNVGTNWQPISAVPEPATGTLMILSGAALFAGRRRRHD